jgi:catechol 2,3-dioxygenase-like lactoylglutathione lyase family enzyme
VLSDAKLVAFIGTQNPDQARAFYEGTLGLTFLADEPYALVFDSNGTMLRIAKVKEIAPQPFTVLGWHVDDLEVEMARLESLGVVFERYRLVGEENHAIVCFPDGTRVAWFKDPDGNNLSLTEFGVPLSE